MTNNKIDFYVLKLKNRDNIFHLVLKNDNGEEKYVITPIFGVKKGNSDIMIEIVTGEYLYKASEEIENRLTYTECTPATSIDLHRMHNFLKLIKNGYKVVYGPNEILSELEQEVEDEYKKYIEDIEAVSDFYVNNMNKITR